MKNVSKPIGNRSIHLLAINILIINLLQKAIKIRPPGLLLFENYFYLVLNPYDSFLLIKPTYRLSSLIRNP
jgi:hypothetical protein